MGEMAYLDDKADLFWSAVRAQPIDFCHRVGYRLVAATLWYIPFERDCVNRRPWMVWINRVTFPLPFLSVMVLLASSLWQRLEPVHYIAIGCYLLYLAPYVLISYYERYAMALVGVKALLVILAADRLTCPGASQSLLPNQPDCRPAVFLPDRSATRAARSESRLPVARCRAFSRR
jgi:hypothetical protein